MGAHLWRTSCCFSGLVGTKSRARPITNTTQKMIKAMVFDNNVIPPSAALISISATASVLTDGRDRRTLEAYERALYVTLSAVVCMCDQPRSGPRRDGRGTYRDGAF